MALSFSAANLPPQPLKRKSSNSVPSLLTTLRNPWSRAQVSFVPQGWSRMFSVARRGSFSSRSAFTAATSGATMRSVSRMAIS